MRRKIIRHWVPAYTQTTDDTGRAILNYCDGFRDLVEVFSIEGMHLSYRWELPVERRGSERRPL